MNRLGKVRRGGLKTLERSLGQADLQTHAIVGDTHETGPPFRRILQRSAALGEMLIVLQLAGLR